MIHITFAAFAFFISWQSFAAGVQGDTIARTCPTSMEGQQLKASKGATADADQTSLMQVSFSAARRGYRSGDVAQSVQVQQHLDGGSCEELTNNGAYFTIAVQIGTPEQNFHLVADTGSDALIIPDCKCVDSGFCQSLSTCYTAGNSTSFGLDIKHSSSAANSLAVIGAKMNYGSGQIQVLVASEHVRVANIHAQMHNGVFLMEDRRELKVHGDFEGIFGLGLPHNSPLSNKSIDIPAFMDASGTSKYMLCFNEYPKPGALRVGLTSLPNPMTNIGTVHWGLDLQGFSVGTASMPVLFCDPRVKSSMQTTACGAIPDSGTTLLMGPQKHVQQLYEALCDGWPRCKKSAETYKADKAKAFQTFLYSCETWLTDEDGIDEIPSIFIHLAGSEGTPQSLELSPWAFVVETTQQVYKVVTGQMASLLGSAPVAAAVDTGERKKICAASFGTQEYTTAKNGPVWIMGAPLFYAAGVGYDIGDKDSKAQISLLQGSCSLCNETASTLLSSGSVAGGVSLATSADRVGRKHARKLRHLPGPIRQPSIDTSMPL